MLRLLILPLVASLALPAQGWASECVARSSSATAALVELYTSEGCSSCPPADRWLSKLGRSGLRQGVVVPLALHVDYWDYIGWRDPFARHRFSLRQRELAALRRAGFVYTPQVLLQGRDFRAWGSAEFNDRVARINGQPAQADIRLVIVSVGKDSLAVEVRAELRAPKQAPSAALYLASYASGLVSRVQAGENEGRTLTHDFVATGWSGPIEFGPEGRIVARRELPLRPGATPAHAGVVAFVQDRRTADILQALSLPACPG